MRPFMLAELFSGDTAVTVSIFLIPSPKTGIYHSDYTGRRQKGKQQLHIIQESF